MLYSSFFVLNLVYAFFPVLSDSLRITPAVGYVDLTFQTLEWNVVSQFGELIFLYFPHLLIFAALILFVAIVSPVALSFVSFAQPSMQPFGASKRQDIFMQTLRFSVDRFAN